MTNPAPAPAHLNGHGPDAGGQAAHPANGHAHAAHAAPAAAPAGRQPLDVVAVIPYLVKAGALSAQAVVEGEGHAEDISRRNRNFRVKTKSGGLLVKQIMSAHGEDLSLRVESLMLRQMHFDPAFEPMRSSLPAYIMFDQANDVLVTHLITPATSLTKLNLNRGKANFPLEAAVAGGKVLALLHRCGAKALAEKRLGFLERRVPNGLGLFNAAVFGTLGAEGWQAWQAFADGPLVAGLPAVSAAYSAETGVVHGDARWDNYLLTEGVTRRGLLDLRLIDWEMARIGDPLWDVACYLGDYFRFWGNVVAPLYRKEKEDPTPQQIVDDAKFPFGRFHASAAQFWASYCSGRRFGARQRAAALARVGQYVPYYIGLIAYESLKAHMDGARDSRASLIPALMAHLANRAAADPAKFLLEVYNLA